MVNNRGDKIGRFNIGEISTGRGSGQEFMLECSNTFELLIVQSKTFKTKPCV